MDKLTTLFFQPERWTAALGRAVDKDIRKDQLYQLTKPSVRTAIYAAVRDGRYRIAPPHAALIPKDTPGEFRRVYVNEPVDRVLLSIANDLLFETMPEMVHPSCRSYLKGIGCGDTVREASRHICQAPDNVIGWKSDLSKYFDSVPVRYIDSVFDRIEAKWGPSAVIALLRDYYHNDLYFDENGQLKSAYQSLKQGCSVAAFLADAILYDIDEKLSTAYKGYYIRYSDDMLYIGADHTEAMKELQEGLARMGMSLNPRKVETLTKTRWFKFLGFSLRGADISLSSTRIKTFQKEIESRTIRAKKGTPRSAATRVCRFLYKGDGRHSWATQVLRVVNVTEDINTLNAFVLDCLNAVRTGKKRLGGLGYVRDSNKEGCIARGLGRNVRANREKNPGRVEGYLSLGCMRNALLTSRAAYDALASQL